MNKMSSTDSWMGDDAVSPIEKKDSEHADYDDIKVLIQDIQLDLDQAISPGIYDEANEQLIDDDPFSQVFDEEEAVELATLVKG